MSATTPCAPCCSTTQVINIPGVAGADGSSGSNGQNAFTTVGGGGFTVPGAVGGSVTIPVANSNWIALGEIIVVAGPASFLVTGVPNSTSVTATWQGYSGDVAAGTVISAGVIVSPGGVQNPVPRMISTAVNYNLVALDDVVQTTVDGLTLTLPTPVGINGKRYTLIQTAAHVSGTTVGTAAGTINGGATKVTAAQYGFFTFVSNGSNWFVIAHN